MDGDGRDDVITGHYWPGDVFLFRGTDSGFAEMENLKDETGRNLNAGEPWESDDEPRMESLAAAPYMTDWDGDGDFDALIGNILGQVVLMENVGTAKEPKFSTARVALEAGGETITVPGGDAGPVFEDWDGDGKRDLVVGAGDGSVRLYRNVGEDHAPKLAEGVALVAANAKGWEAYPNGGAPARPGVRAKVCVTDYDGDGLVDLLLGDYVSEEAAPLELTEEQIARRDELRTERDEIMSKLQELVQEAADQEAADRITERFSAIYEELAELEPRDVPHGFVWLYRRLPERESTEAGG